MVPWLGLRVVWRRLMRMVNLGSNLRSWVENRSLLRLLLSMSKGRRRCGYGVSRRQVVGRVHLWPLGDGLVWLAGKEAAQVLVLILLLLGPDAEVEGEFV